MMIAVIVIVPYFKRKRQKCQMSNMAPGGSGFFFLLSLSLCFIIKSPGTSGRLPSREKKR